MLNAEKNYSILWILVVMRFLKNDNAIPVWNICLRVNYISNNGNIGNDEILEIFENDRTKLILFPLNFIICEERNMREM